jgi:hypothetical protein
MADKMSLDITPTNAKALASICKIYMLECEQMYPNYLSMGNPRSKEIGGWLHLCSFWFKIVALWTTWQIN